MKLSVPERLRLLARGDNLDLADIVCADAADRIEALERLLRSCLVAMKHSREHQAVTDWSHMIDAITAIAPEQITAAMSIANSHLTPLLARIETLEAQIAEDTIRLKEDTNVMVEAANRIGRLEASLAEWKGLAIQWAKDNEAALLTEQDK
jgi:hypothetical protein